MNRIITSLLLVLAFFGMNAAPANATSYEYRRTAFCNADYWQSEGSGYASWSTTNYRVNLNKFFHNFGSGRPGVLTARVYRNGYLWATLYDDVSVSSGFNWFGNLYVGQAKADTIVIRGYTTSRGASCNFTVNMSL